MSRLIYSESPIKKPPEKKKKLIGTLNIAVSKEVL